MVERLVVTPASAVAPTPPRHAEWLALLVELTRQTDRGLVYDREIAGLAQELDRVVEALWRRRIRGLTK